MLERDFQASLIKDISILVPNSLVLKTDPTYMQGVPDILALFENGWAAFECKRSERSPKRPNQSYYVDLLNSWSFARFVYPENKEEVLHDFQKAYELRRNPRIFRSK